MNELRAEEAIATAHHRALAADYHRREAEEFVRTSLADLRRIMFGKGSYKVATDKIRQAVTGYREGLHINIQDAEDAWAGMAYRNPDLICEAEIQVLADTFMRIVEESYTILTREVALIAAEAIRRYEVGS